MSLSSEERLKEKLVLLITKKLLKHGMNQSGIVRPTMWLELSQCNPVKIVNSLFKNTDH